MKAETKFKMKRPLQKLVELLQRPLRFSSSIVDSSAQTTAISLFTSSFLVVGTTVGKLFRIIQKLCGRPSDTLTTEETRLLLPERTYTPSRTGPIRCGIPVQSLDFGVKPLVDILRSGSKQVTYYYSVEPFCVICRKGFPAPKANDGDDDDSSTEGQSKSWQYNILAICPTPACGPHTKFLAVELDLTEHKKGAQPRHPIGLHGEQAILADIHIRRPKVRDFAIHRRREAYPVHRSCWKLAKVCTKNQHINKLIHEFGQSTKDLARTPSFEDTWLSSIRDLTPFFASLDQSAGIVKLLHCLSRSPAEIEVAITEISSNDMLSSVINFLRFTLPLLQQLSNDRAPSPETLSLSLPFQSLTAKWTNVYDHTYLHDLKLHQEDARGIQEENALPIIPMRGIQLGPGARGIGIGALRLLYEDGSESPWLGNDPGDKAMTILGREVTGFRIERDGLKVTRIDLVAQKSWFVHRPDATSDHAILFTTRRKSYMTDCVSYCGPFGRWRGPHQTNAKTRNFNNWRLARYNKLVDDSGEYVNGITVYCSGASVSGVVAHGASTKMIGSRGPLSCAIHLPLLEEERLTSIWIPGSVDGRCNSREIGICLPLLMTTNFGRTSVCSPIWHDGSSRMKHEWRPISNDLATPIVGVFDDGLERRDGSMVNIGITKDNPISGMPTESIKLPSVPVPASGTIPHQQEWGNAFLSIATFDKVKKIEARKRGARYLGLLVHHLDDLPAEVLGQWDPSFKSELSVIYEHTKGALQEICFRFAPRAEGGWKNCTNESVKSFICSIDFRVGTSQNMEDEHSLGESFHWDDLTKPLAWWFTWYADCVQPWYGEFEDVPYQEGSAKELILNPGLSLPEHEADPDFVLHGDDSDLDSDLEDE